jgi:hypothetical protein
LTTGVINSTLLPDQAEELESLPTQHNVVDALKWIISTAKEGDFVYIHYAGHGTAFRPPRAKSPSREYSNHQTTGDLALNLLNEDKSSTVDL